MQSKSLLIALAAFAVTATGVQAYIGIDELNKAGFSRDQIEAFSQAREYRSKGEDEKARDVLLEAGVDEAKLDSLRQISRESHMKLHKTLEDSDYEGFKAVISGSPLADIITTKEDFLQFKAAHEMRQEGNYEQAKIIYNELGLTKDAKAGHYKSSHNTQHRYFDLTDEQRDALRAAHQANDRETVRAILEEAGLVDSNSV
ncbi:MAG: hypothetical protein H6779_05420 [Candidatus Nomurabacteria bacterium]|nr:MAG: hypothetical protein H6779_05420 [Candidatus Nomurabacteria bacterium]